MSDTLGNITVPDPVVSATPFPITTDYGGRIDRDYRVITHRFSAGNRKREQRYLLGTGVRRFTIVRRYLKDSDREALRDFWEARLGPYAQFPYNAPNDNGIGTTTYTCRFSSEPLSWQVLAAKVSSAQCTLLEVPSSAPSYTVTSTVSRFPSGTLATALLDQAQEIVPLITIQCKASGYPTIYVSDRRCTVAGQLYQARMTQWQGISQTMNSASDDASFTFGNADQVMSLLSADTDLYRASIEFALYHVSSQIKLNLWKGEIVDWQDDESPEFQVKASDGFYELRLPYPTRKISRACWKDFNDGAGCPFTASGTLDTAHYPSASGASCDKGFTTPNGCAAHSMRRFFGGIVAEPQGVSIRNRGAGGNLITATSLVNDSVYDQVVPEVYTDSDMPVNCKVAAGRDEGTFYEGLGVVGEGPVVFGSGHTLDKQLHHGSPGTLGLRTITGTDPAGTTDFFSLDQSGNQTGGDPERVFSGSSTYKNVFAAGTAFAVIRRGDQYDIQLTRPIDHEMSVVLNQGLQGWIWTGAGSRTSGTLTNPVWIIVNMILRARGLRFANATTAEQYFDVAAAVAAANICDTSVAKIAGLTGSETQFKFRGVIQDEKPLKDWIEEVLNNFLGFYTFSFGKLKLGLRYNSSAASAFTTGNILLDSVKLSPRRPTFNDITAVFADQDYEYATNSTTVYAIDHKKQIGGASAPLSLKTQINLLGTSGVSQAARIVSTRLKEELGGATAAEWKLARNVSFRTTILALDVEPGMVCSLTHEKAPGGAMEFRCSGWRLNEDYSIDIEGSTTTDSMYDATVGPKPADVVPSEIPPELLHYPVRPAWMPGVNRGSVGSTDPLQTIFDYSISTTEFYETLPDDRVQANIIVTGHFPRNRYLACPATTIRGLTASTSSGSLPAGNYWVQLAPYRIDSDGIRCGPPSNIRSVALSATGKLTIAEIEWPIPPSGVWDGYIQMVGNSEQGMSGNWISGLSLPTSNLDIINRSTYGEATQPNCARVRGKVKTCPWPGVMRAEITALTTSTIVCDSLATGGDAFSGRIVGVISDVLNNNPGVWNFTCSSYDQSTGTFTVSRDPIALGVAVGDMLVVWTAPSGTANTITDTKWAFQTNELIGRIVRVLWGKGQGQYRTITANTATALTVEPDWTITPDSTSIAVVEDPDWGYFADSSPTNSQTGQLVDVAVPIDNFLNAVLLVAGIGIDNQGNEAPEEFSPMRPLFMRGEPFQVRVTNDYLLTSDDRTIYVDATANDPELTLHDPIQTRGQTLTVKRVAGSGTIMLAGQTIDDALTLEVIDSIILRSDGTQYRSIGSGSGSGGGGGGATRVHIDITTSPQAVNPALAADGTIMVLELQQDATGGRSATLGVNFDTSTVLNLNPAPLGFTVGTFYSTGTLWRMLAGWEWR